MAKNNDALAKLMQLKAESNRRYQESVRKYGGKAEPKPVCSLCGAYAHVAAVAVCREHAADLGGAVYCNYCLSNITGITVEEIKEEYARLTQK